MKHRDFHAGQSALGLMTRNTEAMFAPRMAQWEAFGKGLQDANAIVQNRHAFNEQLEQNRINNEFKNKEFGFREKEAEESKRRFDTQMQENQRQFDQRHALDKQNSFYDNKYKESATAYNYWRMAEEKDEKQKSIALNSKGITDAITAKLQVLHQGRNLMSKAKDYLGNGIHMGINKTLNKIWGFNGVYELNDKQNEWVGMMETYKNAYLKDKFANNLSKEKIDRNDDFIDQKYAGANQFIKRATEIENDVVSRLEKDIMRLKALKYSPEYIDFIEGEVSKYKDTQSKNGEAPVIIQKMPTTKELESFLW